MAAAKECSNELRISAPSTVVADVTCAISKEPLQEFIKRADPCVSRGLLVPEIDLPLCRTAMGFGDSKSKPISIEKLEQLANEIVRPARFNKMYRDSLSRPELAKLMSDLARHLQERGMKYIGCDDLRSAVNDAYTEAKKENRIGECYQIETLGGAKYLFGPVARAVSVSPAQQKSIEDLFSTQIPSHLDRFDTDLILDERFTIEDLKELRALRKASEMFEQATPLRNDAAGGFFSNLMGELTGGDQLNCNVEASTHIVFLKTLVRKGVLKKFHVVGTIERQAEKSDFRKDIGQTGHVAVLLRSRETGHEVVYDSWFGKGGEAAHILLPDDWRNLNLNFKNDFRNVVPLLPDSRN